MAPYIPVLAVSLFALSVSAGQRIEPVKGPRSPLSAPLGARQSTDYCGQDAYGDDWYCENSSCCVGATVISCYTSSDMCCETGYTCLDGSTCELDTSGYQWCLYVSGGQTSTYAASNVAPTQTKTGAGTGGQPTVPAGNSGAKTTSPSKNAGPVATPIAGSAALAAIGAVAGALAVVPAGLF